MATGPVTPLCSPFPVTVNGVRVARVLNSFFLVSFLGLILFSTAFIR